MKNELNYSDRKDKKDLLKEMISQFSEKLKEPSVLIEKCFFINSVLSIGWETEEGVDVNESVEELIKLSLV